MTHVADAASWLRRIFPDSDDRLPALVAIEAARREGFTNPKTVLRARAEAGVVSERVGFGRGGAWWWSRDPRVAVSRGRRRHAQSVRPRGWQLDDRTGDVAVSCDRCRRVGFAPIETLPVNCPTATCSGIMRKPAVVRDLMPEPNVAMKSEIEPAVWPGMAGACPACGRAQLVAPSGRCIYRPTCHGVIQVIAATQA